MTVTYVLHSDRLHQSMFRKTLHVWIQRGGQGVWIPPEKSLNYRVSLQYWSGSPENHKATKPAVNVGPSSTHQQNAIHMAFRWRADDGPLIVIFGSSLQSPTKKSCQSWTPSGKTFWICTCIRRYPVLISKIQVFTMSVSYSVLA